MNNKLLFTSITLVLALIVGFFAHNQQVAQLEQKIDVIINEYDAEIKAVHLNANANNNIVDGNINPNISTLENLNNQLIKARSDLQIAQQKLLLSNAKSSVLTDEVSQIKDTRGKVKLLKASLKKSEKKLQVSDQKLKISNQKLKTSDQKLKTSDQKLGYLQRVFRAQNKDIVNNNISRITELQGSAAGIGVAGLLIPVAGVAMLTTYTVKEVNNYCANIKNIIDLDKKVFKKVVSLDAQMQDNYHQKCIVGLLGSQ